MWEQRSNGFQRLKCHTQTDIDLFYIYEEIVTKPSASIKILRAIRRFTDNREIVANGYTYIDYAPPHATKALNEN